MSDHTQEKTTKSEDRNPSDKPRNIRFLLVIGASLVVVLFIGAFAILNSIDDGCGDWERQLADLSRHMTRHRLAEGTSQLAALEDLLHLKLPCKKVHVVRENCSNAYKNLFLAETEQKRAKKIYKRIERLVNALEEPQNSVATLRILKNQTFEEIAGKLGMDAEKARTISSEAIRIIGPDKLDNLHKSFELSLKRSETFVLKSKEYNDLCDSGYKSLIEEGQRR